MERVGAVFHHFAYVTPAQLSFKEDYYGFKSATAKWQALNHHKGSGLLKDYFDWVSDETMFDDAAHYRVEPLARQDASNGRWNFNGRGLLPRGERTDTDTGPRIVVDGIFWQYSSSGIARVWENLLAEWVKSRFVDRVTVLDRAAARPRAFLVFITGPSRGTTTPTPAGTPSALRRCAAYLTPIFSSQPTTRRRWRRRRSSAATT